MKPKIIEICLYGVLGAFLFAAKFAMSSLPNIEPVSLLLISYTIAFGIKVLYPLAVYVFLEVFIYGFGFWSIAYFYIWLILIVAVIIVYKKTSINLNTWIWSLISGVYGLIFGALYMPLYMISGGYASAVTWLVSGLPYDIIHCIANFILCAILFKPITNTLLKLKQTIKL